MSIRRLVPSAALVGTLSLAACVSPIPACPAIGWFNELTVQLEGDIAAAARVELCDDGSCSPPSDPHPLHEPTPTLPLPPGTEADEWVFTTDMTLPEEVLLRVYDVDGALITETEAQPEWIRVGGSEYCGGPHNAAVTVELSPSR